jgi:cobalt transporter subunit CbtA
MIRNRLLAAVAAGMLAGVVATAAQSVKVIPLILKAETYETAGTPTAAASHDHGTASPAHAHDADAWAPKDGLERLAYTLMSNIIAGVGFACVLGAAIMFSNRQVSLKTGAVWGAAGFLVFSLAPALGLPPELPGTEAAGLTARRGWWLLTVVSTAAGLAFIAFPRLVWFKALGVALMVLPHVIGAPHPETYGGLAPGALAAEFAVASLVTAAVFWVVLGSTLGGFLERLGRPA